MPAKPGPSSSKEIELLRKSEERYRLLSEAALEGIVILDNDVIVEANKAFAKTLGYELSEIIGQPALLFAAPESRDLIIKNIRSKGKKPYEAVGLCKDGTTFPVEIVGRSFTFQGRKLRITVLRDITARKIAEDALHESEINYKTLVGMLPDAVTVADILGNFTYVSQRAIDLYGAKHANELLGKSVFDVTAPEDYEKRNVNFQKLLHEGLVLNAEYTLFHKDKSRHIAEISSSLIRDTHGNPKSIISVIRDVTDRKKAEQALRESEENLRAMAETANDGILIATEGGKLVFANRRAAEITGYSVEELINSSIRDFVVPEELRKVLGSLSQRLKGKPAPRQYETVMGRKDGTITSVEATFALTSWKGEPAATAIFRDITERKRAEELLRESEANLRIFAENANDGIIIPDSTGAFVFANRRAAEITGYSIEELLSMTMNDLTTPEEIDRLLRNLNDRLQGKPVPSQYETLLRRKDGAIHPIEIAASVTTWKGQSAAPAIFRDITERKRAEESLRESENKYRALVEQSLQGILIATGIPPQIMFANPALANILGYSVEELLNLNPAGIRNLIYSKDQELFFGRYQERLQGKSVPARYEIRAVRKDGSLRWVELLSSQVTYQGKPAVQAVFIDRTTRREAEEALKESERKYRTLVESSLQGITVATGIPPRLVFVNPALADILGFAPEELIKLSPKQTEALIHPDDRAIFFQRYQERLEDKPIVPLYEIRTIRKDGMTRWLEISSSHTEYQGEPAVQGTFIDITNRKLTEEALRESESRYREIASSIPGVVYQAHIKKDGSISLLFVSEGTRELYGLEPQEIQADMSKMFDIIVPEDLDKYKQMVTEARNSLKNLILELRVKLKTGESKWVRIVSKPHLLPDGDIIRNGVVFDITEHKWIEEQVRRYSEELEEKVRERTEQIRKLERRHADSDKLVATGRMAARIAHEINNPLAGIKNSFLLVKDAIATKHPYYKYVGIIEKEIDRIARIVRRTFDLYRPDQEAPKTFSISAVIWDIVALIEPSASKNHIRFEVVVPETPLTVTLQEGYLTQVLFNIINNAIEASPKKGIIKITANLTDQVLTLVVVDQGSGIPLEIRSNIFEPFFTTKSHEATGGLGLGLSVSKSMVEAMGGNIDFETELSKGTVFRISIPIPNQINSKFSKSAT